MKCIPLRNGFTLIELIIAVGIAATLTAMAVGGYGSYREKADIAIARGDIIEISTRIERFMLGAVPERFPNDLAEIGGAPLDPWGNSYHYLNIADLNPPKGKLRKDRSLVPINSDYDLYSSGPDGDSKAPLTAKASRDDIIRANNGRFIGVAEEY